MAPSDALIAILAPYGGGTSGIVLADAIDAPIALMLEYDKISTIAKVIGVADWVDDDGSQDRTDTGGPRASSRSSTRSGRRRSSGSGRRQHHLRHAPAVPGGDRSPGPVDLAQRLQF